MCAASGCALKDQWHRERSTLQQCWVEGHAGSEGQCFTLLPPPLSPLGNNRSRFNADVCSTNQELMWAEQENMQCEGCPGMSITGIQCKTWHYIMLWLLLLMVIQYWQWYLPNIRHFLKYTCLFSWQVRWEDQDWIEPQCKKGQTVV